MVWVHLLLLVGFLAILIKSSDFFVESVARLAKYFGLSEFLIGLTVVAIGTSLPELGASVMAAFAGKTELAVGNVVGSNLANIGLVLGTSAIYATIKTKRSIFLKDCLMLLGISALFLVLCLDGVLTMLDGGILLFIFLVYHAYLSKFDAGIRGYIYDFKGYLNRFYGLSRIRGPARYGGELKKDLKRERYDDFVGKGFDFATYEKISTRISVFRKGIIKDIAILLVAGIGIYFSAREAIPNAVEVARIFGVTENVIGATILAIGTSLPELSVSIASARRGFSSMLLGNIIGSNIFNIVLVAGVASIIAPLSIIDFTLTVSLPIMMLITVLLTVFVRTDWRIGRHEGMLLLAVYALFLYLLIWGGFG